MAQYYYGALPDSPDHRDWRKRYEGDEIPHESHCDIRQHRQQHPSVLFAGMPPVQTLVPEVYHQGHLESCTANAVASVYRIDLRRQGLRDFPPSRLFLYYNTRKSMGTVDRDSGASIRETVKAIKREGVCPEIELRTYDGSQALPYWEYDTSKFKLKPPKKCYDEARKNKACKYERLEQDIHQFRACLKEGFPFVFGFKVPEGFVDDIAKGRGHMPKSSTQLPKTDHCHAVVAVAYDDHHDHKEITLLNSWGVDWGDKGYFYMPYSFIVDKACCFDFWKIERVSEDAEVACKT